METSAIIPRYSLIEHLQKSQETVVVNRFIALFNQFDEKWTDSSSEYIKDWIATIIDFDKSEFSHDFRADPRAYLDMLVTNVFVDHFFPGMLMRTPVLVQETGWVCEELLFKAYQPMPGEQLLTAVPHQFIQATFRLLHDSLTRPTKTLALRGNGPGPEEELLRRTPFGQMSLAVYPAFIRQAFDVRKWLLEKIDQEIQRVSVMIAQHQALTNAVIGMIYRNYRHEE